MVSAQRIRFATGGSIILKELVPVWINGNERSYVTVISQDRHIDPKKQVSGIAPNFIHSLDSSHFDAIGSCGKESRNKRLCADPRQSRHSCRQDRRIFTDNPRLLLRLVCKSHAFGRHNGAFVRSGIGSQQ